MRSKITRFVLGGLVMPLTLYSFVAALFLNWSHMLCGVVAFVLAIVCWALTGRDTSRSTFPASRWKRRVLLGIGVAVFISAAVLLVSARATGVARTSGLPVFAVRERYFLTNHGDMAEVSRLRFLLVGTSFVTSWHALILLAGLSCFFQAGRPSRPTPSGSPHRG
jgi:hypothetical protein